MDSKELRIGIWFNYFNRPTRINNWTELLKSFDDLKMQYIEPILLTEEILLKCGFEKQGLKILEFYKKSISWNSTFKEISISIQHGNQYVYLREQNDELPNDRMADNIICIFNSDIHGKLYLHKIQNLYFALTNTELEINL